MPLSGRPVLELNKCLIKGPDYFSFQTFISRILCSFISTLGTYFHLLHTYEVLKMQELAVASSRMVWSKPFKENTDIKKISTHEKATQHIWMTFKHGEYYKHFVLWNEDFKRNRNIYSTPRLIFIIYMLLLRITYGIFILFYSSCLCFKGNVKLPISKLLINFIPNGSSRTEENSWHRLYPNNLF